MGTLGNSNDPDAMQRIAAFHQGRHCLLIVKESSEREINHNLENSACDPLDFTMGRTILIVSIFMGNSTRIQRDSLCNSF